MEISPILLDWQDKCSKNGHLAESNLPIQCNLYQNSNSILHRVRKSNLQIHLSKWLRSKTQVTADAGQDVEKEEHTSIFWWDCKLVHSLWKSVCLFIQNYTYYYLRTQIYHSGIYPKDAPVCNKETFSTMFIAALFIMPRSWKEPRCRSTEEWIQKMWYIYTM